MRYGQKALLPEPGTFPDEKAVATFVLVKMDQWFHIEEQVPGRYWTGEETRIDAVLRPRDSEGWHDADPAFGVEFKHLSPNTSTGERYGWVRRPSDTHTANGRGTAGLGSSCVRLL
ncbi:hypothetical protein [Streptomyces sp. NPDC060035]|uniref:hypothetical protein n=1 Tax=Streptomyces sp. NPDC060035 TaxID=3347044 RepID=UPI003685B6EE